MPRNVGTRVEARGASGQVQQEVDPRTVGLLGKQDRYFAADRGSTQRLPVFRFDHETGAEPECRASAPCRTRGFQTDAKARAAAPRSIGPSVVDLAAAGRHKRVGQRVRPDLALVEVARRFLCAWRVDRIRAEETRSPG